MRSKTVPRHLPRKDIVQKYHKSTTITENMEFLSKMKSEGGTVNVKTVQFNNYFDIIKEVDAGMKNKNGIRKKHTTSATESTAMDLTKKEDNEQAVAGGVSPTFKDTYLYRIMTDPNLLQKITQEKQPASTSPEPTPGEHQCPHCKRNFQSDYELRDHLNVQADESNQLSCCACGKSFAQKRYLRYHQRCHSERNKFSCDMCTRKYSRLDNLTRHTVFHTNPRKFPCNSCERTFARKDLLNKHLKCHENKYKYHCDACQKYFKGPVSLGNHVKLFHSRTSTSSLRPLRSK